MPYLSLVVQMEMMIRVKIYLKKKLFVESASLNSERVLSPSRWNVAAKANLLWPTKNVL
jgi:hypothetical protein